MVQVFFIFFITTREPKIQRKLFLFSVKKVIKYAKLKFSESLRWQYVQK